MAYCSAREVRALLGDPSEEDLSSPLIALHQRRADATINGRLRHLYTVPFDPVPDQVRGWAENLTVHGILFSPGFRMRNPVDTATVNAQLATTIAELDKAAKRELRLDDVEAFDPTHSSTEGYTRTFGLDEPEDWKLDPVQREAERARRERGC
jgi:hypothetical protein